jgi:serine/threonine protein phosphatase PrpC
MDTTPEGTPPTRVEYLTFDDDSDTSIQGSDASDDEMGLPRLSTRQKRWDAMAGNFVYGVGENKRLTAQAEPLLSETLVSPLPGSEGHGAWGCASDWHARLPQMPKSVVRAVSVDSRDGSKRAAAGTSSEDSFSLLLDITSIWPADAPSPASAGRSFHLFGVYDGHRSNHASRHCATVLGAKIAAALQNPGVLRTDDSEAAQRAEVEAIRSCLVDAVEETSAEVCSRRWASVIKDNGKKFYPVSIEEVPPDFDMERWDITPIVDQFTEALFEEIRERAKEAGEEEPSHARLSLERNQWVLKKKEWFPGSTLNAVLVDETSQRIFCANVGDSRSIVCHNGRGLPLSRDQKPSLRSELERICSTQWGFVELYGERVTPHNLADIQSRVERRAKAAGKKAIYRVNRDLAVSRAMGDADLKACGVTATPEVSVHDITEDDAFLVVACDGLWDVMTDRQCAKFVRRSLAAHAEHPLQDRVDSVCQALVLSASAVPSNDDDVCAILVAFASTRSADQSMYNVVNRKHNDSCVFM